MVAYGGPFRVSLTLSAFASLTCSSVSAELQNKSVSTVLAIPMARSVILLRRSTGGRSILPSAPIRMLNLVGLLISRLRQLLRLLESALE